MSRDDAERFALDGPFPRDLIALQGGRVNSSRSQLVVDIVDREQPTIRQLLHRLAGARGLFREDYTGTTLRDHYGLARPESSCATARRAESTPSERHPA